MGLQTVSDEKQAGFQLPLSPGSQRRGPRSFHPHFQYQWVDAFDGQRWYEGQIRSISSSGPGRPPLLTVRFRGFSEQHDIKFAQDEEAKRIAPFHAHSIPKFFCVPMELCRPGDVVDACDGAGQWMAARVINICLQRHQYLLHYSDDPPGRFNEWVNIESDRVAPAGYWTDPNNVPQRQSEMRKWVEQGRPHNNKGRVQPPLHDSVNGASMAESKEGEFQAMLSTVGMCSYEAGGAGDCLFRSLSHQLYGDESFHSIVREACCDYLVGEITQHHAQTHLVCVHFDSFWSASSSVTLSLLTLMNIFRG